MSAIQELSRAQRAILGQQFETTSTEPLIKEGLPFDFPYFEAFEARDLGRVQQELNDGRQVFSFVEQPAILVACERDFDIATKSFSHNGSGSRYRGEMERGEDVDLVGWLGPNQRTSLHIHLRELTDPELLEGKEPILLPVIESYKVLSGSLTMHFKEGDRGIALPEEFSLRPGVIHQTQSGPDGAIVAIRMKHAALYPKDLRHIPV